MKLINNYSSAMAAMVAVAFIFFGIGGCAIGIGIVKDSPSALIPGIIVSVLGIMPIVVRYFQLKVRNLVVDDDKLIYKSGIIETTEIEIKIKSINGVIIRRSVFHRIFGGGELGIACQGISGPVVVSTNDMNRLTINDVKNITDIASEIKKKI